MRLRPSLLIAKVRAWNVLISFEKLLFLKSLNLIIRDKHLAWVKSFPLRIRRLLVVVVEHWLPFKRWLLDQSLCRVFGLFELVVHMILILTYSSLVLVHFLLTRLNEFALAFLLLSEHLNLCLFVISDVIVRLSSKVIIPRLQVIVISTLISAVMMCILVIIFEFKVWIIVLIHKSFAAIYLFAFVIFRFGPKKYPFIAINVLVIWQWAWYVWVIIWQVLVIDIRISGECICFDAFLIILKFILFDIVFILDQTVGWRGGGPRVVVIIHLLTTLLTWIQVKILDGLETIKRKVCLLSYWYHFLRVFIDLN